MKKNLSLIFLIALIFNLLPVQATTLTSNDEWIILDDMNNYKHEGYWQYNESEFLFKVGDIRNGAFMLKDNHKDILRSLVIVHQDHNGRVYRLVDESFDNFEITYPNGVNLDSLIGDQLDNIGYTDDDYIVLYIYFDERIGNIRSMYTQYNLMLDLNKCPEIGLPFFRNLRATGVIGGEIDPFYVGDRYDTKIGLVASYMSECGDKSYANVQVKFDEKYNSSYYNDEYIPKVFDLQTTGVNTVRFVVEVVYCSDHGLNWHDPHVFFIKKAREIVNIQLNIESKYHFIGDNTSVKYTLSGKNIKDKKIIVKSTKGDIYYNGSFDNLNNNLSIPQGTTTLYVEVYDKNNNIVATSNRVDINKVNLLNNALSNMYKSNLTNVNIINDTNRYFEDNEINRNLVEEIKEKGNVFLIYEGQNNVFENLLEN